MQQFERKQATSLLVLVSLLLSACNATSDGLLSSWGNDPVSIELPPKVEAYPDDQVCSPSQKRSLRLGIMVMPPDTTSGQWR
jgi:hypothetical protein